jgi:sugar lactone lactonase YvrE
MRIDRVPTVHCLVGEGPLWDVEEQALYFIDIVGKAVHRFDPANAQTQAGT